MHPEGHRADRDMQRIAVITLFDLAGMILSEEFVRGVHRFEYVIDFENQNQIIDSIMGIALLV